MAEGYIRLGKVAFVDRELIQQLTHIIHLISLLRMIVAISASRTGIKDTL